MMAFSQQHHQATPLGIFKIVGEAFKLLTRSFTLLLPVLIIYLLSARLGSYIASLSLPNYTSYIDPKGPKYDQPASNIFEDLKDSSPLLAIFFIASSVLSSLLNTATIHAFTLIHNSSQHSTHNDLLCKLARGIKGPMITSLFVTLLKLGYFLLMLALAFMFISQGSLVSAVFVAITVLTSPFLYLYLSTVWSVSVVISVVEDGCYGLKAISRAAKIIKGRRIQGALLVLIESAIVGVTYFVYNFTAGYVNSSSMMQRMGIGLVYGVVAVAVDMFAWAASTVFFWDCKRNNEGEGSREIQGGFMYVSLPAKAYGET